MSYRYAATARGGRDRPVGTAGTRGRCLEAAGDLPGEAAVQELAGAEGSS